jgi:hypothetical protein
VVDAGFRLVGEISLADVEQAAEKHGREQRGGA